MDGNASIRSLAVAVYVLLSLFEVGPASEDKSSFLIYRGLHF